MSMTMDPNTGLPVPPVTTEIPGSPSSIHIHTAPPAAPSADELLSRAQHEQILNAERERVREEEKNKLYPQIEELKANVGELTAERETRLAAEAEAQQQAAEEERLRQEAEMSQSQRFEQLISENNKQLTEMQQDRDRERALREQETRFASLIQYREEALRAVEGKIMPQFIDYVRGNSEQEIDGAVQLAIQKTEQVVADVQGAQLRQRQQIPLPVTGTPTLDPSALAGEGQTQELSPEDIRKMSHEEYSQYREQLMAASSQRVRDLGAYAP